MSNNQQGTLGLTRYANIELCDFSKMQRTGMVTIRPIKDNLKKETKITIKCFKGLDPNTDNGHGEHKTVTFGIPIGTYPDNTPKFRALTIRNQRTFDLRVESEAMEYHVWRHSEEVQGSPNQGGMPRYMIYDPEQENQRIYGKAMQKAKAVMLIAQLKDDEVKDLARVFGIDPMTASLDVIKGRMVIAAEKNPENVIDIFGNKMQTDVMKIYHKAKAFGLITFEPIRGYLWKGAHPLGSTEHQAMQNLAADSSLYSYVVLEANQKEQEEMDRRAGKKDQNAIFKENVNREGNLNFQASQPVRREINPGQSQVPIETAHIAPTGIEEKLPEDTF